MASFCVVLKERGCIADGLHSNHNNQQSYNGNTGGHLKPSSCLLDPKMLTKNVRPHLSRPHLSKMLTKNVRPHLLNALGN